MKKKYIIVSIIILLVVMVFVTAHSIKEDKELNFLEKGIKDSVNFVEKILYAPIDFVKDKIDLQKKKNKIYKKYKKIEEEEQMKDSYLATIEELEKEIDDLKQQLDLNHVLSEYTSINATVINRNVGYWYNTITIDKGSHDDLKEGYAVVVSGGLIGRIEKVSEFNSSVKLLTTDELSNKISVKINIEGKSVYGLLVKYDQDKKVYLLEGISDSDKIEEGAYVTTTGLSEMFPSGILVGTVKSVTFDNYDLTKVVEVIPAADFQDITVVTVLKREAE